MPDNSEARQNSRDQAMVLIDALYECTGSNLLWGASMSEIGEALECDRAIPLAMSWSSWPSPRHQTV